jgi:nucleoside-diphosphate-sugar epimerase
VDGTRNVLELQRELGVPRGVYTSTVAVFGDTHGRLATEETYQGGPWLSEYDHTKWVAHYRVALPFIEAGLPLVIVQPGGVYGPGDPSPTGDTLRDFLRRRLPMVPQGTTLCWGHVEDTARGHIEAMERGHPGRSYIIAGPAHTVLEVLSLGSRLTGVPVTPFHPPPALLRGLSRVSGLIERVVPLPPTYTAEFLRVAAGVTYLGDSTRARHELGFAPRSVEEGLPGTLAYEQSRLRGEPPSTGAAPGGR